MADQHDFVLDNQTGANFRADANLAIKALLKQSNGATEPAPTYAFQLWADTGNTLLKMRNAANSAWITVGTLDAANLALLSLAGGTLTGILAIKNAAAVGTPDLAFAGDLNTGLFSAGADLLGLVAGGAELLRADGILGYIKLLSTKGLLLPSGTTAQRPTGVAGLLRYNSDLSAFEGFKGGVWGSLGGGGGGAGFQWRKVSGGGPAPVEQEEYGEIVQLFGATLAQELYASVKVPQSYSAGSPISIYVSTYSPSNSGTQLFKAQATLVRSGTDAQDSTTNQRTTTNSALTNTVAKQLSMHTLDVTDASGQINSVAVSAGDVIKVRLYRDATDTDTGDVRFLGNATDVKFS
jgi:hypothetical protein